MSNDKPRLPAVVQTALTGARRPFEKISGQGGHLVTWEKESMFAMQILARNTLLQKCEPHTIRDAVINIASIGLSLNPALKHCALIPRYNNSLKLYECHCDPMYQGLIAIATDGGAVISIRADIVREMDREDRRFWYRSGSDPHLHHEPDPFMKEKDRGEVIGAYAIAEIAGSKHPHITFMSIEEIENVRDKSEMWKKHKKGPWADWFQEMAKKTVIKRAQKTWPKGTGRLEKAVQMANIAEGYAGMDEPIEAESIELISEDEAKELRTAARKAHLRVERIYKAFNIDKMEELPKKDLDLCRKRINQAGLKYILKSAEDEPKVTVSAKDWGMTYSDMEALGAEFETKATISE
jgi:recombination protein RecT